MKAISTLVATLGICLAVPACSSPGSSLASGPLPAGRAATQVAVSNHNWSDMVIYAVRAGTRYRLGMVTTNETRRFRLPRGLEMAGADLRLVADPVGGFDAYESGAIHVAPGQTIELSLENHLAISSISVWNR